MKVRVEFELDWDVFIAETTRRQVYPMTNDQVPANYAVESLIHIGLCPWRMHSNSLVTNCKILPLEGDLK